MFYVLYNIVTVSYYFPLIGTLLKRHIMAYTEDHQKNSFRQTFWNDIFTSITTVINVWYNCTCKALRRFTKLGIKVRTTH
jgi:hypothetical protein